MKVLIIGSGGREHALAWKCAQTADAVIVAPGNAGTARENGVRNAPVSSDDIDALIELAHKEKVNLTIVGPEAPLVAGIVDRFEEAGLPCFGPSAGAAQLEGSKAFTKDFLARHHIPTGAYENFTELEPALAYIRAQGAPIVIKADGLAAGKGVAMCETPEAADTALIRKSNAAEACMATASLAFEVGGGPAFSRSFGVERLFRLKCCCLAHRCLHPRHLAPV